MNDARLTCNMCEEPITGEPGVLCAHCDTDAECGGCGRGEEWAPGCWYIDGESYTCEHCGAEHIASVDDDCAALEHPEDA